MSLHGSHAVGFGAIIGCLYAKNRQKEYGSMTTPNARRFKLWAQEFTDMWKRRRLLVVVTCTAWCLGAFVLSPMAHGEISASSTRARPTAVSGESWLSHLHRSFDETSMGQTGWLGPALPAASAESERLETQLAHQLNNDTVTLHGSDLYRMNCRGCHGEDGQGAPPEINSVINPVRATSAAAVMERMKNVGMDMSRADATKLAQQSKAVLLGRLQHGGQDMPAFPHLGQREVDALIAYLRQLAGVRGAEREQVAVKESRVRAGEYIVKSTCHVCHGAAGPNPTTEQLYEGAIPPLNKLAMRTTRAEFIQKVTQGAPVLMGTPPELHRGRMPVFYYLSAEEAADVYLYLTRYPPYQWATLDSSPVAGIHGDSAATDPTPRLAGVTYMAAAGPAESRRTTSDTNTRLGIMPAVAGSLAIVLMGIGLGVTVYELKKISIRADGRRRVPETEVVEKDGATDGQVSQTGNRELVA
jgi:mono/diheme cytochrome c family protein